MALYDDLLKGWGPAVLVGVGMAVIAPVVAPAAGALLRPLVKSAIAGYLTLADKARELVAEAGEQLSDIVAEVHAERAATTPVPETVDQSAPG